MEEGSGVGCHGCFGRLLGRRCYVLEFDCYVGEFGEGEFLVLDSKHIAIPFAKM